MTLELDKPPSCTQRNPPIRVDAAPRALGNLRLLSLQRTLTACTGAPLCAGKHSRENATEDQREKKSSFKKNTV